MPSPGWNVTSALVSSAWAGCRRRRARARGPSSSSVECAAAISSSGLVLPFALLGPRRPGHRVGADARTSRATPCRSRRAARLPSARSRCGWLPCGDPIRPGSRRAARGGRGRRPARPCPRCAAAAPPRRSGRRRAAPRLVGEPPGQRGRGQPQVHGVLERQPAAEQQLAVDHQHAARGQLDVVRAGGPVRGRVPQRRQHPADAARPERGQHLAGQPARVEPVVVARVRVVAAALEPQRGRPQEVARRTPAAPAGPAAAAARRAGRRTPRAARRRAVDGHARPPAGRPRGDRSASSSTSRSSVTGRNRMVDMRKIVGAVR